MQNILIEIDVSVAVGSSNFGEACRYVVYYLSKRFSVILP